MTTDLLIVAAGIGSRLKAVGNLKPLVEVQGVPLIKRALETAFSAGVTRAVIVTGYHSEILENYLLGVSKKRGWNIETIFNPEFEKPNGLSVLKARDALRDSFFLTMCDHMVEKGIYENLQSYDLQKGQVALGVDLRLNNPMVDIDDVTKVDIKGTHIKSIGKTIKTYNAFDTGVFRATTALFDAIEAGGDETGDYSISAGMLNLASENNAIGVDIEKNNWIDVDSPEMLKLATEWLKKKSTVAA